MQNSIANVTRFIDKAKQYTNITELNAEASDPLYRKIAVDERGERYSRTSEQEIVINYRDIGVIRSFAEEAEKTAEQRKRQTA